MHVTVDVKEFGHYSAPLLQFESAVKYIYSEKYGHSVSPLKTSNSVQHGLSPCVMLGGHILKPSRSD